MKADFRIKALAVGIAASMAVLVGTSASAVPDNYAFGFSDYDGNESLTLNGSTPILTNGFQGWVSNASPPNTGGPDGNTNYIAGTCCFGAGNVYADYFVFSLAGVTAPVTSAVMSISPFSITQDFTFVLHDATPYVSFLNDAVSPNPTLYSELGTGTILGSFAVTPDESDGPLLTFDLNSTALSDLNAAIADGATQFAISGTVLGQAGSSGSVPEPASWAMMLVGLGAIGFAARRRQNVSLAYAMAI